MISLDECKTLVEKLYNFKCVKIQELVGYDDKNFKIMVTSDENNVNDGVKEYVLKIMNKIDSNKTDHLEAQHSIAFYLANHNVNCSQPIKNKYGNYYSLEKLESGQKHIVRAMIFLPGVIFNEIHIGDKLLYQAGKYIAQIDKLLQNFNNQNLEKNRSLWMLETLPLLKKLTYVINDDFKLIMIQNIMTEFENRVLDQIANLPKSAIHGDMNEQNIVVNFLQDEWKITGILDFGDCQKSCTIFELAILITYMILLRQDIGVGGIVIAGYTDYFQISDFENSLLKICVMARLCQSLILGAYGNLQNPNNSYLLTTAKNGWDILQSLNDTPEQVTLNNWKMVAESFKRPVD